ncbi:MAG: outer membrane beta-barrel protein [Bacteroidales bacterium]
MKKFGLFVILVTIILQGFSQEVKSGEKEEKQATAEAKQQNTIVSIGREGFAIEEDKDAWHIRLGNRGIEILESLEGGPKINFERYDSKDEEVSDETIFDQDEEGNRVRRSHGRFKGHWSGIEFGFNNYMLSDRSLVIPDEIYYMNLNSSKSNNFNFNFTQQSFGLTRRIGLVTGLGLNWNNYRFDGDNNIQKGTNGVIDVLDPGVALKKSKLTTAYLTVPLLAEIQIPTDNHHLNVSAGVIGGVKIGSHTKMITRDDNKIKAHGDFSLNLLRYGYTARIGYESFQIYGTYYATPLFKAGKGPEGYNLYPFEVGIALTFND